MTIGDFSIHFETHYGACYEHVMKWGNSFSTVKDKTRKNSHLTLKFDYVFGLTYKMLKKLKSEVH